jgi:hypothetical protein
MKAQLGFDRGIWGYDTFTGMTQPTAKDTKPGFRVDASRKFEQLKNGGIVDWCYVPLEEVRSAIDEICGDVAVNLVQGDVRETLLEVERRPSSIAILRLDTDFYESTKVELEQLYPIVSPGGVVIVDDYGVWHGSRLAVDEYFGASMPWLHYVNRGVRLFVKPDGG